MIRESIRLGNELLDDKNVDEGEKERIRVYIRSLSIKLKTIQDEADQEQQRWVKNARDRGKNKGMVGWMDEWIGWMHIWNEKNVESRNQGKMNGSIDPVIESRNITNQHPVRPFAHILKIEKYRNINKELIRIIPIHPYEWRYCKFPSKSQRTDYLYMAALHSGRTNYLYMAALHSGR